MASIMAFQTPEIFSKVTIGDTIANVDFRVAPWPPNDSGDVQLVQILLSFALLVADKAGLPLRDDKGVMIKNTGVKVDGIVGPQTTTLIRAFQRQIASLTKSKKLVTAKAPIRVDGIVDHSSPTGVSTQSKTIYTIVYLNVAFISETGRSFTAADAEGIEPLFTQLNAIDLG